MTCFSIYDLTPISTTSGLWSTGNTRKYQQIDVYIYQCGQCVVTLIGQDTFHWLALVSANENRKSFLHDWKIVDWDLKHQNKPDVDLN